MNDLHPDWTPANRFAPRTVRFLGVVQDRDWSLKHYTISLHDPDAPPVLAEHWAAVADALPQPAVTTERPGVGFVIEHRGRGMDYLVLAWWDQENELPLRIWVRDHGATAYRAARNSESVCVWDLELMGFERDAYVHHVLSPTGGGLPAYLATNFHH